jgi:hypothetical protein
MQLNNNLIFLSNLGALKAAGMLNGGSAKIRQVFRCFAGRYFKYLITLSAH